MSLEQLKKEFKDFEFQCLEVIQREKIKIQEGKKKFADIVRQTHEFLFVIEVQATSSNPEYMSFQENKGMFSSKEKALHSFPRFWNGQSYFNGNHEYFFRTEMYESKFIPDEIILLLDQDINWATYFK